MTTDNIKEYLKKIGSKGGNATKAKYGKEHYQKLAENMNKKRLSQRERLERILK